MLSRRFSSVLEKEAPPTAVEPGTKTAATFGDAVALWLEYLEVEKRRKIGTLQDARNVARSHLLPRFGAETPLRDPRDGRDTFSTDDIDDFRRELLATHLSPRTVQKLLVLLHGVFKLAKRRKLIFANPSADAERVPVEDPGTFNILEPAEFEHVHAAVIDELDAVESSSYGTLISVAFYAGLRLGELRDLPWRNVDLADAVIRVESSFTHGDRSTPKGKRARSTPVVPLLATRLETLRRTTPFARDDDYVFCNPLGERIGDAGIRKVFYAGLADAGLAHRRDVVDRHGNPQAPMRVHDLRHSWCTWAVNVWPLTKVQAYAGHRDIKTTQRYVHHQTKAEDAALGGAYLDRVLPPRR
jgi:integrase